MEPDFSTLKVCSKLSGQGKRTGRRLLPLPLLLFLFLLLFHILLLPAHICCPPFQLVRIATRCTPLLTTHVSERKVRLTSRATAAPHSALRCPSDSAIDVGIRSVAMAESLTASSAAVDLHEHDPIGASDSSPAYVDVVALQVLLPPRHSHAHAHLFSHRLQSSILSSGCSPSNRATSWKLLSGIWPSTRELWP